MLLNEIINTRASSINYDTFSNKSYFEVHSVIDDVPYAFTVKKLIHRYTPEGVEKPWSIVFGVNTFVHGDGNERFDAMYDVDLSPTGKKNSVKIMTWVEHCFDLFIQRHGEDVQRIIFSANTNEPSRVRLYDRFTPVLKRKGWELQNKTIGPIFVDYTYERIK